MLIWRAHSASPPALRAERSGASSRENPAAISSRAEVGALRALPRMLRALPSIESRSSSGSAGAGPAWAAMRAGAAELDAKKNNPGYATAGAVEIGARHRPN